MQGWITFGKGYSKRCDPRAASAGWVRLQCEYCNYYPLPILPSAFPFIKKRKLKAGGSVKNLY
jgi:hypothetical protein